MTPSEVRALLERYGLAAHRDRGQNFLADARLAAKLVEQAGVGADDTVLEIGTGLGILTRALAARAARVVSIEIDSGLVRLLRAESLLPENAELVHGDALTLDLRALLAGAKGPVRAVGNLPYAISSPLLRRLLDLADRLDDWSVMLQREVAERMAAAVGARGYGSLAVIHAWVGRVERGLDLHPRCFHPVPRVASRVVRCIPHQPARLAPGELARLEPWLRAGFGHRRKTLANALRVATPASSAAVAPEAALAALGLPERVRAEALDPGSWLQLARRLADPGSESG